MRSHLLHTAFFFLFCFVNFSCAEPSAETVEKQKALSEFESWFRGLLETRKESIDALKVVPRTVVQAWRDRDAYRGLFATEDVAEGDLVLAIPWHLMITTEKIGEDHPEVYALFQEYSLNQHECLAVYLVYLKQCKPSFNFWAPWIKILPTRFNSILYFTPDEIKLLGESFIGRRAVFRQQQSKDNYDALATHVFPKLPDQCGPISYDDWKWAETIVESRGLELINDGTDGKKFSALPPYFDLFNHEDLPDGRVSWGYNSRTLVLHAEASRNHNPSEQLFISYGSMCNDELLEKYGFILDDNQYRCVHVDFNMLLKELEEIKAKDTKENEGMWERRQKLLMDKAEEVTDYSFKILPTAVTEEVLLAADILSFKKGATPEESSLHRIQWLIKTVSNLIKGYPKSAKEDEALIASPTFTKISRRARWAIKLRHHERELLEDVLSQYKEVEAGMLQKGGENPKRADKEEL